MAECQSPHQLFLLSFYKILSAYSGRLRKLFNKSMVVATTNLKVIFQDLPGGAVAFELMARFCYNNGRIPITPPNVGLLHCVAHFMEMDECKSHPHNLIEQTQKFLDTAALWTWMDILAALKQTQDVFPAVDSSGTLQKFLDSLVSRIISANDASPPTSSPDSSGFRFSCDTRSTESTKNYSRAWWFEDLATLNSDMIEKTVKTMVARKLDHAIISRFLIYYLKSRTPNAGSDEKKKIIGTVVELLFLLDRSSVSSKGLFGILRVTSSVDISKSSRCRLESMIGSQLDQAKLDNLLIPAPAGANFLYDVNLVLRFLKSFLGSSGRTSSSRLKRAGSLMDMYISEVAPDPCLKPSKFIALVTALPDSARDSYDGIYQAVDMYLEVHAGLSEEEKMKICCGLNYEKLSSEACNHLAQNLKFPSRTAIQALISQQSKLKSLLQDTDGLKPFGDAPCSCDDKSGKGKKEMDGEQIVLYARKLDISTENEKLKAHLQGMQWRVMELEKVCRKMQTQMTKIMKAKLASSSNARSLPKLCS
ncbi:BTB/POZ domain-containing protein At3g22104 isoform X2 [Magnolia sinica]|uniref:BTB/POZ domain-containing protein At3g22104 isoform X2 n=1 Tax=Magnolia sinica TaxID=86752 RepID=UPI00265B526A|nr:BTB/POZ domain-containing protein At3g22104 isoform X2 [Magnolia sinica]